MRTHAPRIPSAAAPVVAAKPMRTHAAVRAILRRPSLQPTLKIGAVDDPAEREADRVADEVMRMPDAGPVATSAVAGGTVQRLCADCEQEKLQRKADAGAGPAGGPAAPSAASAIRALGGGAALVASERAFFEPRFGRDFSQVRLHQDAAAGAAARSINARAFALGGDIAFASGEYAPGTRAGRRLLAHELTHVVQQRAGETPVIRRQDEDEPPVLACDIANCRANSAAGIRRDLDRALDYVNRARQALTASPRSAATSRALDWYFNDDGPDTVTTVHERLGCIADCLQDTRDRSRYGCDLPDDALAYVDVLDTAPCTQVFTNICLTSRYFSRSDRIRAEVLIHECAHRVGMSLGTPASFDDVYDWERRFAYLDTSEALLNSDSYALFAGAIRHGVRATLERAIFSLGAGRALPGRGTSTWYARLYLGTELQHPILGMFNPILGVGFSWIGETESEGAIPTRSGPSMLISLLPGIRIGDPRPGSAGGGYVSFFGGPALAVRPGEIDVGAEAGMALGYRWRWLDVSASFGTLYDPTREGEMRHLYTAGVSVTFTPGDFLSIPSSY